MNQSNIFSRWLNYLEVPYSKYFSEKLFQEHPHKYTLYGISNLLSSYGIENVCVELKDKESIFDLSTPFLARLLVVLSIYLDILVRAAWRFKQLLRTLPCRL